MKKKTKNFILAIAVILIWNHLPYHYDNEKKVAYVTSHSAPQSRSMCAWYVMKAMWCGELECELKLKEIADVTSRCIPFGEEPVGDKCICCGKPAAKLVYWGKAY